MHNSSKMAKIIVKQDKSDKILKLISWKEIIQIYFQSLLILFYIAVRNILLSIKNYFDKRFGATRQKFVRQFYVLSSNNADNCDGRSNADIRAICPATQNPELGEHKYIRIKHTRFHYVEKGEENDRVVLLLHGFPDCFFGWRNQIGVLSQNHRVIALDLKGFNDSDRPVARSNYKPDKICYELKCFIDALEIKSVCIIGHDLGAILGWIFALKYPDYVNKFFCISTPHPNMYWNTAKNSALSKYWFNMIQIPFLPEKELSKNNSFIHETHKHLMCEDVSSNEINRIRRNKQSNLMETYEYIFSRPEDYIGPLNYFRNLLFYRVKSSLLIRCPCILIYGTDSPNFPLETAVRSAEYCENALIKIVNNGGYWPHQTQPKELNEILLSYLAVPKKKEEEINDLKSPSPLKRGIMGRVMEKVYNVGQQYGM